MTATTEKLGLYLPDGLHERMVRLANGRTGPAASARGAVRRIYEDAFRALLDALDAGEAVTFPAVRGAKGCTTIRVSQALCARLRARLETLNLKLTDFACTAIHRYLSSHEGV